MVNQTIEVMYLLQYQLLFWMDVVSVLRTNRSNPSQQNALQLVIEHEMHAAQMRSDKRLRTWKAPAS